MRSMMISLERMLIIIPDRLIDSLIYDSVFIDSNLANFMTLDFTNLAACPIQSCLILMVYD